MLVPTLCVANVSPDAPRPQRRIDLSGWEANMPEDHKRKNYPLGARPRPCYAI